MYFDTGWLCGLPLTWTILHFCSWFLGCLQSLQAIAAELFARLLVSWFFFGICHWLLPHRSTAWCFGLGAVLGGLLADLASWSGASLCTFFLRRHRGGSKWVWRAQWICCRRYRCSRLHMQREPPCSVAFLAGVIRARHVPCLRLTAQLVLPLLRGDGAGGKHEALLQGLSALLADNPSEEEDPATEDLLHDLQQLLHRRPRNVLQELKSLVRKHTKPCSPAQPTSASRSWSEVVRGNASTVYRSDASNHNPAPILMPLPPRLGISAFPLLALGGPGSANHGIIPLTVL